MAKLNEDRYGFADEGYETNCGTCGSLFFFKDNLKDWTSVWCARCSKMVSVR